MQSTHPQPINITLVFGDIEHQQGLDAVIKVVPNGTVVPFSGGLNGTAGTAMLGYWNGGEQPPTIWCISPTLRRVDTVDVLARAIRQGLQRAAIHDFQRVGIEIEPLEGTAVSFPTFVRIVVDTVDSFARHSFRLGEFRLVASDSQVVAMAQKLIDAKRDGAVSSN